MERVQESHNELDLEPEDDSTVERAHSRTHQSGFRDGSVLDGSDQFVSKEVTKDPQESSSWHADVETSVSIVNGVPGTLKSEKEKTRESQSKQEKGKGRQRLEQTHSPANEVRVEETGKMRNKGESVLTTARFRECEATYSETMAPWKLSSVLRILFWL